MESHAGAAQRLRADHANRRMLVADEHGRSADLDLGMPDSAVRPRPAHQLLRAEGFFVKLDSFGRALDCQVRRDRSRPNGNWIDFARHSFSPCVNCQAGSPSITQTLAGVATIRVSLNPDAL